MSPSNRLVVSNVFESTEYHLLRRLKIEAISRNQNKPLPLGLSEHFLLKLSKDLIVMALF